MPIPPQVEQVFEGALVSILSYPTRGGWISSHPMLPLYDREKGRLYFTSSILFSKKLEHIKKNPKVSVLFSGREFIKAPQYHVVHVKGDAKIYDEDVHSGWMWLLEIWRKKEPYIDAFLKQRIALPLF
ncbi:MAG: pyridoxamine 5'-phosphate oxidase family protein, partial [Nitrososphaerota archaeon]